VCRPTREEAFSVAVSILQERDIARKEGSMAVKDDSQMYREASAAADSANNWLTRSLWSGLVPYYGPVWTTLLGTPGDIAEALLEYKRMGVTQFIMSGWPELDEVTTFGREVLPLVREAERGR
jgi:alkanesulfonate monooxygenase